MSQENLEQMIGGGKKKFGQTGINFNQAAANSPAANNPGLNAENRGQVNPAGNQGQNEVNETPEQTNARLVRELQLY